MCKPHVSTICISILTQTLNWKLVVYNESTFWYQVCPILQQVSLFISCSCNEHLLIQIWREVATFINYSVYFECDKLSKYR